MANALRALALTCLIAATAQLAAASAAGPADDPFLGRQIAVDSQTGAAALAGAAPDEQTRRLAWQIARQPQARWLTDEAAIDAAAPFVADAVSAGRVPVLVLYAIPLRDCAGHSAGGAASAPAYRHLVSRTAALVRGARAAVILEPDALTLTGCLSAAGLTRRERLLTHAVGRLRAAGASVYLDAGHADWLPAAVVARRLARAGVARARGVALNVSSTGRSADQVRYGRELSGALGRPLHLVIDTSRNGAGPGRRWCNPAGRALGRPPGAAAGPLVDAYLWVKRPGESDGTCAGGPPAGVFWADYALGLARRASER